jgi:hypothetical protein
LLFAAACGRDVITPTPSPSPTATSAPSSTPLSQEATLTPTTAPTSTPDRPTATRAPATPSPTAWPTEPPQTTPGPAWQVETLLVAPGEPGRLYALMKDSSGPLWAFPASDIRLMVSDDFAVSWAPFPGGLPVPPECMVNVNLDYYTPDALYASTCEGLYVWDAQGEAWEKRSDRLTDAVAVAFSQPNNVWATAHGDGVIRSTDGGRTWQDASTGLTTFGGMANLGFDPRDNRTLYAIIQPKGAGSYLRRGAPQGSWLTMPTPQEDAAIDTGMTVDGGTGALYVTTLVPPVGLWRSTNPNTDDVNDVEWELVHDFGPNAQVSLLASGWGPQELAIYANIRPLTPAPADGASVGATVLHRSLDGGQTWEPLAMP